MVAVRHQWFEAPRDDGPLDRAVSEVEALASGLPRPLLAASPAVVRTLATRAVEADRAAVARRKRIGAPPAFTADSIQQARAALGELRAAREDAVRSRGDAHQMLALGNAFGVAAIFGSAALVVCGLGLASPPVVGGMLAAASGPVLGAGTGLLRRRYAAETVRRVALLASDALEEVGAVTYGQLRAAELQLDAWERRQREASAAREVAKHHREAWHRLAGPKADPAAADALLLRVEALRQAQIRLVIECIREVSARKASAVLDLTDGEARALAPQPPDALPSRFAEVLDRIRGRHLRLWT